MDFKHTKGSGVVHISRSGLEQSSRVQYQIGCDGGTYIRSNHFIDLAAVKRALQSKGAKTIVFHQHNNIANLFLAILLCKTFRVSVDLVFDIHDLHELKPGRVGIYSFIFFIVASFIEHLVFYSKISFITVSPDIRDVYRKKFNVDVHVVLNMAPCGEDGLNEEVNANQRLVYFGVITKERVNEKTLRPIFDAGYSLDLYGRFGDGFSQEDLVNILPKQPQIRYLGPYEGHSILKQLAGYCASWMAFDSGNKNIHFCLPNKLFQSLSVGTPCIVHENMVSARALGGAGFSIYSVQDFLQFSEIRRSSIELYRVYEMENRSRYLRIVGI